MTPISSHEVPRSLCFSSEFLFLFQFCPEIGIHLKLGFSPIPETVLESHPLCGGAEMRTWEALPQHYPGSSTASVAAGGDRHDYLYFISFK